MPFPFFFVYLGTILYCSDIVWSEDLSAYFFCFLPNLYREFSFLFFFFCFLPLFHWEFSFCFVSSPFLGLGILSSFFCVFSLSWIGNFPSLCVFFRGQGLTFSPWVKVYDKLGFWLKACRTAGHDICQGLASGLGIKGMPNIISMTRAMMTIRKFYAKLVMHAPMWTLKHQFFYGHVTLGLMIHFPYFKSTQCFQTMFFYQIRHSSESILGIRKIFTAFTIHVCTHILFSKTG